jgi:hypothetical protein
VLEVRLLLAGDDRTHLEYAVRITVPLDTADRVPSDNKKVAACAHFVRSGERGTEAAPATSGTLCVSAKR